MKTAKIVGISIISILILIVLLILFSSLGQVAGVKSDKQTVTCDITIFETLITAPHISSVECTVKQGCFFSFSVGYLSLFSSKGTVILDFEDDSSSKSYETSKLASSFNSADNKVLKVCTERNTGRVILKNEKGVVIDSWSVSI